MGRISFDFRAKLSYYHAKNIRFFVVVWVILPLALCGSLVLIWQGVPLNMTPYVSAHTLEGGTQVIPQGPVAALEFIKNLGTNGGGFFNAQQAHPYANPTPLTNFVGLLAIAVLPASLTITFGQMAHRPLRSSRTSQSASRPPWQTC